MEFNMINDIKNEILRLKKEKDVCIIAHTYQGEEILEVADYTGDSYKLSLDAKKTSCKNILMCGVRFMAETAKILSPEKRVVLANGDAGCPMAEQMSREYIEKIKKEYPDYSVVVYINTTASLKTVADVCVTSASALKIVRNMENKNILFIPDCNLGGYIAENVPEKNIKLLNGGCPVHAQITADEAKAAKCAHKDALLLVHPECKKEVVNEADFVGSTSAIIDFAKKSDKKEFIIGTEISIVEHLQFDCPDKKFYPLSKKLVCDDMKLTTLMDVYSALKGEGGLEITLDCDTIEKARHCIDEMIRLG